MEESTAVSDHFQDNTADSDHFQDNTADSDHFQDNIALSDQFKENRAISENFQENTADSDQFQENTADSENFQENRAISDNFQENSNSDKVQEEEEDHQFEIANLLKKNVSKAQCSTMKDFFSFREKIYNIIPSSNCMPPQNYKEMMVEFCSQLIELQDFTIKGIQKINKTSHDHMILAMRLHLEKHTGQSFCNEAEKTKKNATGMIKGNKMYKEEYLHLGSKKK